MKNSSYIISARRTAIGSFGGVLRDVPLRSLGTTIIKDAFTQSTLTPDDIEEVLLGNVLQAGQNNIARFCAVDAGIPVGAPASVINQQCASGMASVQHADRMIRCGDRDIILAGGLESMSSVPYISRSARWGARMGNSVLEDELSSGLTCGLSHLHMGGTAENIARHYSISREEQDEFALRSQQKTLSAIEAGRFKDEITPVEVPQRKGDPIFFDTDEYPRQTSLEQLAKLKPAFQKDGTVTAGNASGINDGAAAIVIASQSAVDKHGLKPIARIVSTAVTGVEPEVMGLGPITAMQIALQKANLQLDDMDLVEINEAFAAQVLGVLKEIPVPLEKLNVNGGGIALGHPIGCSGARILVTLLHEMKRRNLRYGLASLCVGGGMGSAVVVEMV
ncbi:MAG: acetyl-CoA C-acetyltransferase [Abditibacteriaceae bacterium]